MIDNSIWNWEHVWAALPDLLLAFVKVTLVVTILGSAIAAVAHTLVFGLRGAGGISASPGPLFCWRSCSDLRSASRMKDIAQPPAT
ncbi:MAG TPA: hypothetical protein PLS95_16910 [Thermoanaerobaculales bacterium]|nr:hypothetical protein [Thermoanaerobaculales bacterium]